MYEVTIRICHCTVFASGSIPRTTPQALHPFYPLPEYHKIFFIYPSCLAEVPSRPHTPKHNEGESHESAEGCDMSPLLLLLLVS